MSMNVAAYDCCAPFKILRRSAYRGGQPS